MAEGLHGRDSSRKTRTDAVARGPSLPHVPDVSNRKLFTPAPSTAAHTAPILERARDRVPRRVEHFQGELGLLEELVLAASDGEHSFAEIARKLGIAEREAVAVALALSGKGAVVLTAPKPKRVSGVQPKTDPRREDDGPEIAIEVDLADFFSVEDSIEETPPAPAPSRRETPSVRVVGAQSRPALPCVSDPKKR